METQVFKIRGLDCAEEVAILKRELGPLAGGAENLDFDVLSGKMSVSTNNGAPSADEVCLAVGKTGMAAQRWEDHLAAMHAGEQAPFWEQHGRKILCWASGLMIAGGTLVHAQAHGWLDALGDYGEGHAYPLLSIYLYSMAIVSGAWFVMPKAVLAARRLRPDMNLLMVTAIIGAVILGEWFEAAAVAFLFSVALLLETWSVGRARKAIGALVNLSPTQARTRCSCSGEFEEKPVETIAIGATVQVRPGEKIPLDGVVTQGMTAVNQAPITGESVPASKEAGDDVYAGSINLEGTIEFEVTHESNDTTLARIIHMVEAAQARRAPSEQWVERFARIYTPAMMVLALAVGLVPPLLLGGAWSDWFYQALVVLVVACPCALVISTPVSIVAGLTSAAKAGVLIKGGLYLEAPASIKAIAFDKTGTITHGQPQIQAIVPLNGHSDNDLLDRAAALESHSDHPLARAILRAAGERGVRPEPVEQFQSVHGKGAEGIYEGRAFWIGSHRLLHEKGIETPECHDKAEELEDAGHSVVAIGNDQHVCGLISVADSVREESPKVVAALRSEGIAHIEMLTGDNEGTAAAVAEATSMDAYQAELLPHEKVDAVSAMVKQHGRVAMVGDGINDAPAMATSSLGIVMGAIGSDAAIEAADIALMSDDLAHLPWLIRHSRRTLRIIKQNVFFALGLKLIFIVLAMFGLATLWLAIATDMGASLLVIFNGLRLLKATK